MPSMAEKKKAKRIERRGAKPKTGKDRYPGGSIVDKQRGEPEADIIAVAMAQPHRRITDDEVLRMAGKLGARSPIFGHASTRAFAWKHIDKAQLQALDRYMMISHRYMSHVIGRPMSLPAQTLERVSRGASVFEMDEADIATLKSAHADMLEAIQAGLDYRIGEQALRGMLADRDPGTMAEMGAMREALNRLCWLWKIPRALDGESAV